MEPVINIECPNCSKQLTPISVTSDCRGASVSIEGYCENCKHYIYGSYIAPMSFDKYLYKVFDY